MLHSFAQTLTAMLHNFAQTLTPIEFNLPPPSGVKRGGMAILNSNRICVCVCDTRISKRLATAERGLQEAGTSTGRQLR